MNNEPTETKPVCSDCGQEAKLRPYGKNMALVCYPCGMKDPMQSVRNFVTYRFPGLEVSDEILKSALDDTKKELEYRKTVAESMGLKFKADW